MALLSCSGPRVDVRTPAPPAAPAPEPASTDGQVSLVPLPAGIELAAASYRQKAAPPVRITTADGTDLAIDSIDAETVVEGPLAFTELRLTFSNPEARRLEGQFRIALPPRAAVSRFAMKVGSRLMEAEMVERTRARQIYEDFLHRKVDPALLEQSEGGSFSARIFPIEPLSQKEIIISWSQELAVGRQSVARLRGLPRVGELKSALYLDGAAAESFTRAAYLPEEDLVLDVPAAAIGRRSGPLAVARLVVPDAIAPADAPRSALLLVDTSASRTYELEDEVALTGKLAAALAGSAGSDAPLAVVAFDQLPELVYAGPASGYGAAERQRLLGRRALGASDLAAALGFARELAREATRQAASGAPGGAAVLARGFDRVVVLTDGVATAGPDAQGLVAAARSLAEGGIARLDAVVYGAIRDPELLGSLVAAGLARAGTVIDAGEGPDMTWRRLSYGTASLPVRVPGASWHFPESLPNAQPGDTVLVYAELPGLAPGEPASVVLGDAPAVSVPLGDAAAPLVARAMARARLSALEEQERREGASPALARTMVELSTRARVASPYTSLLVLETDADYERYGLDQKALADILTPRAGRLVVSDRRPPPPAPDPFPAKPAPADPRSFGATGALSQAAPPPTDAAPEPLSARGNMWGDAIGDSFGAGGLGLSGVGEGGGGRGEPQGVGTVGAIGHGAGTGTGQGFGQGSGRLAGTHRSRPPQVRMGATTVSGRLPPEVVQRVVRMSFGRFRGCYEAALRRNATLAGRVVVRFVIGRDGSVAAAQAEDQIGDSEMSACVAGGFRALTFPVPEGGIITVTYPLQFAPGDGSVADASRAPQPLDVPSTRHAPLAVTPERAEPPADNALEGRLAEVMGLLDTGERDAALAKAQAWQASEPADLAALLALGEALEARGELGFAARAYGSIVDLYPARADLRRYAGARLERLAASDALDLAVDTYTKARDDRPDHPTSHRLLAYALLKRGRTAEAFDTLRTALKRDFPARVGQAVAVLKNDLGLVAAAYLRAQPERREQVLAALAEEGVPLADGASLRFVLSWESDSNDVDLHVYDQEGGHAYYGSRALPSGGALSADITNGYGPEEFILGAERSSGHFVQVHYYARGPMGYGLGKVEVIEHDGHGNLTFDERPFVLMRDRGIVSVGSVGAYRAKDARVPARVRALQAAR
ncbi:MAG: AgmX/PglI C-terminal domain-containing protein [Polyangiaceae bacterium]|nr:AgmX/PglI C-terminal domain-containing protein [Polyangiaceae bacterium]